MSLDTLTSELATKWAGRFQKAELTEEEAATLEFWLLADPAHADAFSEACYIFATARELSAEQRAEVPALPQEHAAEQQSASSPSRWRAYALAASAVFATVLGVLWFAAAREGWLPQTYRTSTAEMRILHLPDGSVLHLNARTTIRWSGFLGERRATLIAGQVLFQVAHDAAHPFYVQTDDGLVRVLGTKFDLNRHSDATILTVLEGAVDVQSSSEARSWHRIVYADQRLAYGPNGLIDDVRPVDASRAVRWREFSLDLEKVPLSAVIEELSRYTDQPILLRDDRLKAHQIVGTLQVRDIREALHDLEEISPVVVRQDGTAFVVDLRAGTKP
jgi:transmembrane sensor